MFYLIHEETGEDEICWTNNRVIRSQFLDIKWKKLLKNRNKNVFFLCLSLPEELHPAWQVVHISGSGHILDIKVLPAICQLPSLDVVDHGAEGVGVHGVDVDLSLPGFLHVSVQHSIEDWRLGAKEIFVNSECL